MCSFLHFGKNLEFDLAVAGINTESEKLNVKNEFPC